ncbi:IS4/IS5 family transposase [Nostoc flagelliforme]|uniref:IS4/IS5 family transposase n=1 Tax=Nostoc flagelliforme TaxID=1306274 RepID=UPI001A7EF1FC
MVYPWLIAQPKAFGSERDQVIPLLDSVKVKTNRPGRPRKRVKVLAADKGYDSKDKRAALRKRGIRPQLPKRIWKIKKNRGRPIKISVPPFQQECCFAWYQKKYRCLVVQWERISDCFNAFLSLATIHIWINRILLVG